MKDLKIECAGPGASLYAQQWLGLVEVPEEM